MVRSRIVADSLIITAITLCFSHRALSAETSFDLTAQDFVDRFERQLRSLGTDGQLVFRSCQAGSRPTCTYRYKTVAINVNATSGKERTEGVIVICAKDCEGWDNVIASLVSLRVLAPGFQPNAYGRWARVFNDAVKAGIKPEMILGPVRISASIGGLGILTFLSANDAPNRGDEMPSGLR